METYAAQLEGTSADGTPCDDDTVATWARADEASGDLDIRPLAHAATVSIPASYNVSVHADGDTDVDFKGWLEGTVEVVVGGRGAVGVNTVRGLLTRVVTAGGDVRVDHVEGNLEVSNGAFGTVSLGKIMGEDVRVESGGGFKSRAVYAKRLDVRCEGGANAAVLSAEEGLLDLRGDSTLNSAEGALHVTHRGGGPLTVQASESLRALTVRAEADDSVTVHLPSGMGARAEVLAETLAWGDSLAAVEAPRGAGSLVAAPEPLSMTGTKEFAGYEHGSTTSDTPWWSAAARNTWVEGAGEAVEGSAAYLVGGATVEGRACELRIVAASAAVTIDAQSWFEQRLKARTERKPQPYR